MMSPVNDNRLSSAGHLVLAVVVSVMLCSGCIRSRRHTGPSVVSDRLVSLLIQNQLPLGTPDSPIRAEVTRCGEWIRRQIEQNSGEMFRLDTNDNRLVAISSGASRMLVPELSVKLTRLNAFFHANTAVPRSTFSQDTVRTMLLHPESQARMMRVVQMDLSEQISETGGVVMGHPEDGYLDFHRIESDNARWVRLLKNASTPEMFAVELRSILAVMPFLQVRAERTLDVLRKPDADKQSAIDGFMELLVFYSRHSYILEQGTQYAAIAESGLSGIYMGVFHVHPPDNPPSLEDRAGSLLRKNFVLVPRRNEIEVHYLDFTGSLSGDPEVVRFPADITVH